MEGFLRHWFGGLMFGGAYTWRGLFSELYGMSVIAISLYRVQQCRRSLNLVILVFP